MNRVVWICGALALAACSSNDSSSEDSGEQNSNVNQNGNDNTTCDEACQLAACETACGPNGSCAVDASGEAVCTCDFGFTSMPCVNENECLTGIDNCSMNATCTDSFGSFSCTCNTPFTGDGVTCSLDSTCDPNPCQNLGVCAPDAGSFSCTCQPGFSGDLCEVNIDDCSGSPCQNGGACIDQVDGFACDCPNGFIGDTCQTEVQDCTDDPCENGTCNDTAGGYTCTCFAGFSGNNCQININDCAPNPCLNGGACTDGVDTFTCDCQDGFSGDTCATDACSPNPCENSGVCNREANGMSSCTCADGFSGNTCATDACTPNPCDPGATCVRLPGGSSSCECPIGTTGASCDIWVGATDVAFCDMLWDDLADQYPEAGPVDTCDDTDQEVALARALMNVNGLSIDNDGTTMAPCISVRCDDTYAYVATNALPHYDYVPLTPNDLEEFDYIFRFPISPAPLTSDSAPRAVDVSTLNGCVDAVNAYVADPGTGTNSEPSGYCSTGNAPEYHIVDAGTVDEMYVQRISCLGTTGFMSNGVPTFGPNEGPNPDPWGNPLYFFPDNGSQSYTGAAALDLCGGHTGTSMHYHGANQACFELDDDNKPAISYAVAALQFDYAGGLEDNCTEPSPVIGRSVDGYPIRGPCVCVERDMDNNCTTVKRVRSSWVYSGLKAWLGEPGANPDSSGHLDNDGIVCTNDATCCGAGSVVNCDLRCVPVVADDATADGGTVVEKRCALLDYSWCANEYINRSSADVSATNFVYLDRCNGFDGPDGYGYHAINSFPMFVGCYRGAAPTQATAQGGGGGTGGGPTSCTMDSDCVGACDPDASGACECAPSMTGNICASACNTGADCLDGQVCGGMGYCRPGT